MNISQHSLYFEETLPGGEGVQKRKRRDNTRGNKGKKIVKKKR